ncbi:MAG: type II secretion system F family protein [Eubacteriaceae bacterium]|nr:type II secretion system F family protein [Eubacteriaceae bacterium]
MNTEYDTYCLSKTQKSRFLICSYAGIAMLCLLFYHSLFLSAICGFLCFFLLGIFRDHMAEKRRAMLLIQFKDLLYSLSASTAAGRQMAEALAEGLDSLRSIYDDDTPMIRELKYIVKASGENRGSEEELLKDLAARSGCEDIRNFVDVYTACRETGGNMESVIGNAAEVLTDKMTIEREIKTLTAQKQFEGNIITAMPVLVVLFLNVFSPDYLEAMYITVGGRLVMTLALAGMAGAYMMILKLTKIEV